MANNYLKFLKLAVLFSACIVSANGLCRPQLPKYNFDLERFLGSWKIILTGFTGVPPPSAQVEECVIYNFTKTDSPDTLGYGYQHKVNGSWLVTNEGYAIVMDLEMPSIFDIRANRGSYITSVIHTDYDSMLLLSACRDDEEQYYIGSRQETLEPVPMTILSDLMAGFGNLTETRPIFHQGINCIPPVSA
ncbi:hypothetical protein Ocin01_12995 [Orchesella cincta]|uniref:Apolipoprotein D n=1 Tax=Orchesella cincta TaxID=48709 RepID=A0A1D2MKZ3_ORCCI|nr:hypothetical protein Ocin01_12995 [Orchesella cincta]